MQRQYSTSKEGPQEESKNFVEMEVNTYLMDDKCLIDPQRDCLGLQKANMLERQMEKMQEQARDTHNKAGQADRLAGGRTSGPKEEMGFHQG